MAPAHNVIASGETELGPGLALCLAEDVRDRAAIKAEYIRLYSENIGSEISAGVTLYGPHRDDIEIKIGDMSARSFASQGQQRSIVLAMKLGEGEVCRELTGEYPVFLFDDVLSELDEKRREYVLRGGGDRQIIITSCESEEYISFADREIDVSDGKYEIIY